MLLVTSPPTSWLTSCLCATCPSDVGIKPAPRAYVHWYYFDLKVTRRAGDYITGNTSCIVLNFAWPHWPGYSFIIYGNVGSGRTRAQSYLENRGHERNKKKKRSERCCVQCCPFHCLIKGLEADFCVRSCLRMFVRTRLVLEQNRGKRHNTQTIREAAHMTSAPAAERRA